MSREVGSRGADRPTEEPLRVPEYPAAPGQSSTDTEIARHPLLVAVIGALIGAVVTALFTWLMWDHFQDRTETAHKNELEDVGRKFDKTLSLKDEEIRLMRQSIEQADAKHEADLAMKERELRLYAAEGAETRGQQERLASEARFASEQARLAKERADEEAEREAHRRDLSHATSGLIAAAQAFWTAHNALNYPQCKATRTTVATTWPGGLTGTTGSVDYDCSEYCGPWEIKMAEARAEFVTRADAVSSLGGAKLRQDVRRLAEQLIERPMSESLSGSYIQGTYCPVPPLGLSKDQLGQLIDAVRVSSGQAD